ncbi:MAG TPA: branched-chain amino acid ABC transporter substrate-binding protein [Micromonosporaceae bacterium]|nr:branched-chain amino acid ABC transporter substrate-binding protein [Micromonosporaceae bacterium]
MRQKFARVLGGIAVLALTVGAAACKSDSADGGDGGECGYKIAFFGALTGPAAGLGINENNGVKLAVHQYNEANPDCKVELVSMDSQGSPDQAPGLAQKAIDDTKILGVVGPAFSGESEAANPAFAEAGLVHVTASATRTSLSSEGWKTFFRVVGNDQSQAPAAAWYIKDVLKAEKVFVIDDQTAYGTGLADAIKEALGSAVVASDKVESDGKQNDFSATITKIKSSGATAVYFGGYYPEAGLIRKQMTAAGVTAVMISDDGAKDDTFVEIAGTAAEGTIVTCPCAPAEEARGNFVEEFKKLHNGTEPGTYSDAAYDAANILLAGIKEGKKTRPEMLDFVKNYNGEGVSAKYKFTETGELDPAEVKIWIYKVEGGKIVPVQEAPKS